MTRAVGVRTDSGWRGRLGQRLGRSSAPSTPLAPDPPGLAPTAPLTTEVEFAAYAEDCRIFGFFELAGERFSDVLNGQERFTIHDVLLAALEDGRGVEAQELVLERDELLAVRAVGPRGVAGRRVRTVAAPVTLKTGPYTIHGYLHGPPGADLVANIRRRKTMVPLTEAWIEYVSGSAVHRGRVGTIVVNRELLDWIVAARDEEVRMPDLPAETKPDPRAKDLTGAILTWADAAS